MCPESTRPFSLPWGGDLTHAVSLWCYCYCRRLCIATCLGSMCFPLLEWSPCLVASWVIASPIWETQRRQQKENRNGCTSKREREWKTGQGSRETGRQITWWMRDETGRVLKWEGFGVPILSLFLSNSSMNCYSERCWMALTNKALTGPCCNVLLCGPSALSTLTERFSYRQTDIDPQDGWD